MPRINFLICGGVGLLNAAAIIAQNLPKHPAPPQIAGYQVRQQKIWNKQQLPKNSILFKSDNRYDAWQSHTFNFKKEKEIVISLPSIDLFTTPELNLMNIPVSPQSSLLQTQLFLQRRQYNNLWKKQSWWKDTQQMQGSLWLRNFLIQSKSKNNFRP